MFCPGCGKQVPPEAHFCPSCGQVTAGASAPAATAVAPAPMLPPTAAGPGFWARVGAIRTWKKVVFGIVAFIALVIVLAVFMTSGLDGPVERHFAALKAGNFEAAYAELSIATQKQTSLADFKGMVGRTPMLTHVVGHSFTGRSRENGIGKIEGALEIDGGATLPVTIELIQENGQWKILSYHVTSLPSQ